MLLPSELLSYKELKPSLTAQIFGKAFSSIFYDCNEQWDKSNFWNKVSSRKKDKEFCDLQVGHSRSGKLGLPPSCLLHMISLLPASYNDCILSCSSPTPPHPTPSCFRIVCTCILFNFGFVADASLTPSAPYPIHLNFSKN